MKSPAVCGGGDQQVWMNSRVKSYSKAIMEMASEYPFNTIYNIKNEIVETEDTVGETVKNEKEYADRGHGGVLVIDESVNEEDNSPISRNMGSAKPYPNVTKTNSDRVQSTCHSRYPNLSTAIPQQGVLVNVATTAVPVSAIPASAAQSKSVGLVSPSPPVTALAPVHQIPIQISNSGISYQIVLSSNNPIVENSNDSVQYTLVRPQDVFLQQTATPVNASSPVVISQPSVPIENQLLEDQIVYVKEINGTPVEVTFASNERTYCVYCDKHFKNAAEHEKLCWTNPKSKNYKFRKIAPTPSPQSAPQSVSLISAIVPRFTAPQRTRTSHYQHHN